MKADLECLFLQAGELNVGVVPALGGSIASFHTQPVDRSSGSRIDWLRPASEHDLSAQAILEMGCFPLVPFCNRIRGGRASFAGRQIDFPPNHPASSSPHSLHGLGWQRPWSVVSKTATTLKLALAVDADRAWPWQFAATQDITLRADALSVTLTVTNCDSAAMPAGLGFHPYFLRTAGTRLTTDIQQMWHTDAEILPTRLGDAEVIDQLHAGVRVDALDLDNNFTGWSRSARIDWPADTSGPARCLRLHADTPCDYLVIYAPPGGDAFCVEPVTQCTDWLNLIAQYDAAALGGASLGPGESLSASMSLHPELIR